MQKELEEIQRRNKGAPKAASATQTAGKVKKQLKDTGTEPAQEDNYSDDADFQKEPAEPAEPQNASVAGKTAWKFVLIV